MDPFDKLRVHTERSRSMDNTKPQYNLWFVFGWFGTVLTTFVLASITLVYISPEKVVIPINYDFKLYAALPQPNSETSEKITTSDARAKIVENFFLGYKSSLLIYSEYFIQVADKYYLDWRLLPAISMQESNGGKKIISNSYNPFGYGIYGDSVVRFSSWEEGIERVAKALREDYLNKGLDTPYEIMTKYTPPSLAKGGSWAKGVSSFMEELK